MTAAGLAALLPIAAAPAFAQAERGTPAARFLPDGTPRALVGRWGDNGDCKRVVFFREDGSFLAYTGGEGRWSVASDVIIMAGGGGTIRLRVLELEPGRLTLQNADGSLGRSQRCDGDGPPEADDQD